MPKDFLQGASLKPTFIQHFKCGELQIFHIRFNIVKKHPPQNRTNVQIKGGGGQRPFEQCSKKLHFSYGSASLSITVQQLKYFADDRFAAKFFSKDFTLVSCLRVNGGETLL